MRNIAGNIILLVFLFIALSYYAGLLHSHNLTYKTNTEFSLQEEHQLVGDLEIKHNSRSNSGITYRYKNLFTYLPDFTAGSFKYILQVKPAKGIFLLKKHLLLIYVYHNFW